jgi:MFS transporter, FSR family, fosmidomycin resistance protein
VRAQMSNRRLSGRRPVPVAAAVLAALAVEVADELVDGTQSAAMPLIRDSLGLSYSQVGLLASVPLIAGSLIELPMGVAVGMGPRRRQVAMIGGLVFIAAVLGASAARTFGGLLAAFVIFFPASGAFVSLTQAALMDSTPGRQAQLMARWTVAGAIGAVAGPLLLAGVVAAGGSWRTAYLVLAAASGAAWLALASAPLDPAGQAREIAGQPPHIADHPASPARPETTAPAAGPAPRRSILRRSILCRPVLRRPVLRRPVLRRAWERAGLGWPVLRWLVLLEVADLLLDAFTGFVALYLVAVDGVSPERAALAVGVRLAADLAGSAALIPVLERVTGRVVLRASAAAAVVAYPAFLLVPGFWAKVGILAGLSLVTAAWYPVLQAELYGSLPGRSGTAVSLLSAAGLVGGLGPLAVGFLAGQLGLGPALALLAIAPVAVLLGAGRPRPTRRSEESAQAPLR